MEKTVILLYQDGGVCSVLHAAAPCGGLADALSAAERDWNGTKEGTETDYDSFIVKYLSDHGYEVRLEPDVETYRTCL